MTLRAWPLLAVLTLELVAGCSGKSKRTQGLDSTAGVAGDGTSDGTTAAAGSSDTGTGASGATGGSSGTSSGASNGGSGGTSVGTSAGDGGTGAASASPDCVAYRGKGIAESCTELVTCGATLGEYMDALRAKGVSDWAAVRQGCGLVEITPRIAGEPDTLLTFDADGVLVGYWITEPTRMAPCDDYKYVRGTQFDPDCEDTAFCRVESSATSVENLCGCPCPDPPPPDGIVIAPRRCVLPVSSVPNDCRGTADQEQSVGSPLLALLPPTWTRECGTDVASFGTMECVYDAAGLSEGDYNTGPLLGVRGSPRSCPGVTIWMTEGTPPPCTTP